MLVTLFWVGLIIIGALVIHGTIVKNKWGINLRTVSCPNCETPMPRVRAPASKRQALWGGIACPKCGCEMDKWGRRLSAS
jgi:hypothetical protein